MAALALPVFQPATALTRDDFETKWERRASSSAALTKPKEFAFVVPSSGISYKVIVATEQVPSWVAPTISGFIRIHMLPDNWDSYSASRIDRDLIKQALLVIEQIMDFNSPPPSVVPLGSGGLQLEWHRKQQDLEISFTTEDPSGFFYRDRRNGVEQEGFATDIAGLAQLMRNIA